MQAAACSLGLGLGVISSWAQDRPRLLAEFTTARDGEPILLPLTMGGQTYRFLLDTGANRTTFDESLESLLGQPKETLQVETTDRKIHRMNVYYAPEAFVGPLGLQDAGAVFCVDLTSLREATGLAIDGVLGNTFLRRYAVQIDFDAGKVRFYQSENAQPDESWGQATKMSMLPSGVPVVAVGLAQDIENIMLVDTGYGETGILPAELFDALRKEKNVPVAAAKHLNQEGQEVQTLVARVGDMRLGENRYVGLILDRSETAVSMLGLGFLSRHIVTFDFPNDKLYLKPGLRYNLPDEIDMSGLHLLRKPQGVVVHSVDADSPAAVVGMATGDILRRVNGQDVGGMSLIQIRKMLRAGEGKAVEIIFQRGEKGYKTTLTLKKQI